MNRQERDAEIKRLWEQERLTLEEIGSRFNLTRERARQILRSVGAASSPTIRAKRKVAKASKERDQARSLLVEAAGVLKTLYGQGATKQHAVDLLATLYSHYDRPTAQAAVEASKLRFHQAAVAPRFSDAFITAAVHWVLAKQNNLMASREDTARQIDHELLEEIIEHFAEGLMPSESLETILREIAGGRVALGSGVELSMSHASYEETRSAVWGKEGWAGSAEAYWPPTKQTVMRRIGNGYWGDAMTAMGLKPSERKGRSRGLLHYTEADYQAAITEYYRDCQTTSTKATHAGYVKWIEKEKTEGRPRPSGVGLRNFFGNWTTAIQFAQTTS